MNNRVSAMERATIRCIRQVKITSTPLKMKGFHLLTHLMQRRMRTWMNQRVIQVGIQTMKI